MKKILVLFPCLIVIVIAISCKQSAEQQAYAEPVDESEFKSASHAIVNVTPSDTSQYYLLNAPCAVVVFPDSAWVANEQKKMPEDEWNTIVDDYSYYTMLSTDTLRDSGIAVHTDLTNKRYLVFKGPNSSFTLDNDKLKETWAFILFNGTDEPTEWSGMDIYTVLDSIYHK